MGLLCLLWDQTGLEREVMKSGLMCLIVMGMKQNSQNVPSLHGVELKILTDEMLESSAEWSNLHRMWRFSTMDPGVMCAGTRWTETQRV